MGAVASRFHPLAHLLSLPPVPVLCNDVAMSEEQFDKEWIEAFARRIGVDPIDGGVIEELLGLAGDAARDSTDRRNAPISCFLAGYMIGTRGDSVDRDAISPLRSQQR